MRVRGGGNVGRGEGRAAIGGQRKDGARERGVSQGEAVVGGRWARGRMRARGGGMALCPCTRG